VPATSSPTVKRRRLAAELHACREQAGLTIDDVADDLEWSAAKISRIENARVRVLPRDVKHLLRIYGITEDNPAWDILTTLARESRQKGWWHAYGDTIGESFSTYVGLEADATEVRTFESQYVPGLLQTEEYAREVIRSASLTATDEDVEKYVALRMERQLRLAQSQRPELWIVVDESALRRTVGGSVIMRAQLKQLLEQSERPHVTLQLMPFSIGAHAGMGGAFTVLSFPEPTDPEVVYVNYTTGNLFMEKPEELSRFTLIFNHLRATALSVSESRRALHQLHQELK
jgi:transcriptional regulator with XRE-family HTH domain